MDWRKKYKDKLVSAEEAVQHIKSGDRVVSGHGAAEPTLLLAAMVERAQELRDVEVTHMIAMGPALYTQPGMEKSFRHNAIFVGASTRKAIQEGRGDFTPSFFYQVPDLFRKGYLPVDVALVQVSLPNENGECSFGISADYTEPAARCAKTVIAHINPQMPYTFGAAIALADIDWIVEKDEPIIEVPAAKIGELEYTIGRNVADLIPDEATLQIGIGAIPDATLACLKDRRDLGIHSELLTDCVVELIKAGVVTNRKKTLDTGKTVAGFLMGTRGTLYEYVDRNPDILLRSIDYVNNPCVIGQIDNMVSVNSAIEVDLMGQVNSETIGGRQYSGVGGQVDFVRGTAFSKNGKSIITFPATTAGGKVSRIVAQLPQGTPVTTSRMDVHYIVTEYGAADLRGKTLRQRAKALINIAHPDFREKLEAEFWEINRK